MPNTDPRVDAYLAKAQPFAQPILEHLRALVHRAVPDAEESIKWGMPFFLSHGTPLANLAAFKAHCAFGFWKAPVLDDPKKILQRDSGMGALGKLTKLSDLPADKVLLDYLKRAAKLNEEGVPVKRTWREPTAKIALPRILVAALKQDKAVKAKFDAMSPSCRREYAEWIAEAKTEPTAKRRLDQALEWIAEGKARNWKYAAK